MSTHNSFIHLALAFDQNFITPFYVLLTSVFENNKHNNLQIHAVATGVGTEERQKIADFVKSNNALISFYEVDEAYVASFATSKDSRYGLATFYRLLLPAMLPLQIEKIIYIDVDVIVIGDLAELYNIPIPGVPIAAVPDPVEWDRLDLDIPDRANYFNAGVLLINIALWKSQHIAEKAIKFLKEHPEKAIYVDQDALNAVLIGNWLKLGDKFNYTYRVVPRASQTFLNELLKSKTIIHYNESVKPWHRHSASPLKYVYHNYFRKSPISHKNNYFPIKYSAKNVYEIIKYSLFNAYINYESAVSGWRRIKLFINKNGVSE